MTNSPGEMEKFERWMKRYWKGVPVIWLNQAEEYDGLVQIAWEVWIFRGLSDKAAAAVNAAAGESKVIWIVSVTVDCGVNTRVQRCQTEIGARQLAEKWSRDLNAEVDISEVKATCVRRTDWREESARTSKAEHGL